MIMKCCAFPSQRQALQRANDGEAVLPTSVMRRCRGVAEGARQRVSANTNSFKYKHFTNNTQKYTRLLIKETYIIQALVNSVILDMVI